MAEGAQHLGRIARNRRKTGIIVISEQDNADLWNKIRNTDEQVAHLVSARIVQFAQQYEATILVFEVRSVDLKPAAQTRKGMIAQANRPVTT